MSDYGLTKFIGIIFFNIFKYNSYVNTMSWIFKGTPNPLLGNAKGGYAGFSTSINADGTVVAVGAPQENTGDGQVKVYTWNSATSTWSQWHTFDPIPQGDAQAFGISVSLSADGNTLAVGETTSSTVGRVHVYHYNGSAWTQLGNTIVPSGIASANYERFGTSVSLAGNSNPTNGYNIVIGASSSSNNEDWGHAQVYTYNGTTWNTYATDLSGSNTAVLDMYATSVSMSADRTVIAIGAPAKDDNGAAYVYAWNPSTSEYVLRGSIFTGTNPADDYGRSVAISGDGLTLVVGAPFASSSSGYIQAHHWNGSAWEAYALPNNTGDTGASLGSSVSLTNSGNIIVAGTAGDKSSGNSEYVQVFTNNGGWSDVKINNPAGSSVIAFGFAVSLSSTNGNTLSIGAPTPGDSYIYYRSGNVLCLAEGTRVLTPAGYVPVQDLKKFEHITTADGRNVMIKHIHHSQHFNVGELDAPYHVPANALGENIPMYDVKVSPDHLIQIGDNLWLTPRGMAKRSEKVVQYGLGETVQYYAIMTPNYFEDNLVIEGGVVVESYGSRDIVYDHEARAYYRKPKSG